jgi:hypothetical protein
MTEPTTRELLELAAKALGYTGFHESKTTPGYYLVHELLAPWNPAIVQADSDRMACKLRIETRFSSDTAWFTVMNRSAFGKQVTHNNTDEDVCRAVREARLLMAAEIGRMK